MAEIEPIAKSLRRARKKAYSPKPLIEKLQSLLSQHNESYREASLRAGLDNAAIQRIILGQRPSLTTCVYLANHFGINPNEFLELASWPRLKVFDITAQAPESLPNDVIEVALRLSKIAKPGIRQKVSNAILTLLEQYFEEHTQE